jgi:hypothetical protein
VDYAAGRSTTGRKPSVKPENASDTDGIGSADGAEEVGREPMNASLNVERLRQEMLVRGLSVKLWPNFRGCRRRPSATL